MSKRRQFLDWAWVAIYVSLLGLVCILALHRHVRSISFVTIFISVSPVFSLFRILRPRWNRWRYVRRKDESSSWPTAEAIVTKATVALNSSTIYGANVVYTFFLNEYRAGHFTAQFDKEQDADRFAQEMREKHITIRHNPQQSDISVIDDSTIQTRDMLLAL